MNLYTSRYFLFKGSLTVPPCTEDVTWYVMKDQLAISSSDLRFAKKIMVRYESSCMCCVSCVCEVSFLRCAVCGKECDIFKLYALL